MSRLNRIETMKQTERTPLIDSLALSEPMPTGVSWGVAAFLLVNTALGAGMLNYPYAYNQIGGILAATLMQVVLLVLITSTMFILVYCADFNQDNTYHDVLLSMCGKRAQQVSAMSILLTCYGINVTFLVIIGDQYDRIFISLVPNLMADSWFLDRKFTIFITAVLFIWPMCYAQRLDFLRHASILGMFAMLYVAFLTVYEHYKLDDSTLAKEFGVANQISIDNNSNNNNKTHIGLTTNTTEITMNTSSNLNDNLKSTSWFATLAIVPVLCFAYQTHEVIVPVYACMQKRSIGHFMKATVLGLILLFFLYNLVGAFGYLTFGANVNPDIMSLYDAKDPVVVVGIVALVIKFITTYPPLMFCGRSALDGLYGELRQLSLDESKSTEKTRRVIITTLWFLSTVALAVFAPDISITLQLLGSMASINVFVFPGMCLISLTRRLRRARLALLFLDDTNSPNQQRAKDYHIISGSYFSDLKRRAARAETLSRQHHRSLANGFADASINNGNKRQHFTTTFASFVEFDNNESNRYNNEYNEVTTRHPKLSNGYGSQLRHHFRQENFERLIANGSITIQDPHNSYGRPINDSYDEYTDCNDRKQQFETINSTNVMHNGHTNSIGCAYRVNNDVDSNISFNNKDPSLDRSTRFMNNNHQQNQCLNNSLNNMSTTGSLLDRLGSSIAPTTVAQVGISRCAAIGLYSYSAMLITFGAFIFVLEIVNVMGFL